jgi:Holliday junction DNA helicase RuvB
MSNTIQMNVKDNEPTNLAHLIGMKSVTRQLDTAVRAYFNDRMAGNNPKPENVIMTGPPGVGKTTCARVLHNMYGFSDEKFKEVIGANLGLEELYQLLISADEDTTIYIDEAMSLSDRCQDILLKALDEQVLIIPNKKQSQRNAKIPLAGFLCIFSLTDEFKIASPLRQRFPIQCRFTFYDYASIRQIVFQRSIACGWKLESEEIPDAIAARSKQIPRLGLRLLQGSWRVARSYDENTIRFSHVNEAIEQAGLDSIGCDQLEQSFLRLLYKANKPVRLNVIGSSLGLPPRTISSVVEDFLVRADLIERLVEGRALTTKGRIHVEENLM